MSCLQSEKITDDTRCCLWPVASKWCQVKEGKMSMSCSQQGGLYRECEIQGRPQGWVSVGYKQRRSKWEKLVFFPSYVGKNPLLPYCVILCWESPLLSHRTHHFWHFRSPSVWRMSPHQFPDTSWMSCSLTQFWHYQPGDSVRFHKLRAQSSQDCFHRSQVQVVTSAFDWPVISQRFPQTSPWVCLIC